MPLGIIEINPTYRRPMIKETGGRWFQSFPSEPPISFPASTQVMFEDATPHGGPPGLYFAAHIRKASLAEIVRFGPDAPAPIPVVALSPAEKKRRVKDKILADGSLKEAAQNYLRHHTSSPLPEQTVCFMWKIDGDLRKKPSGKISNEDRRSIGARLDKETFCAEEHLLAAHGASGWIFSLAYDAVNGWKRACQAGCAELLAKHGIEDLAAEYRKRWP